MENPSQTDAAPGGMEGGADAAEMETLTQILKDIILQIFPKKAKSKMSSEE